MEMSILQVQSQVKEDFQVSYNTLSDSRLKTDISNVITRNEYVETRSTADDKGRQTMVRYT